MKSSSTMLFLWKLAAPALVLTTTALLSSPALSKDGTSEKGKVTVADVLKVASNDPRGTETLLQFLRAPSAAVRKTAATALGRRGAVEAENALATVAAIDKSAAVREAAKRARGLLRPPRKIAQKAVVVEVEPAQALSKSVPASAIAQLTSVVRSAIASDPRRIFHIKSRAALSVAGARTQAAKTRAAKTRAAKTRAAKTRAANSKGEKGYALLLAIRSVTSSSQANIKLVEVRCELTLLSLPSRALRLASSAQAAAGIEGSMTAREREELIADAVNACGPALASDFLDYALSRPSP